MNPNHKRFWFAVVGKATPSNIYASDPKQLQAVEEKNIGKPMGTGFYTRVEAEKYALDCAKMNDSWTFAAAKKSPQRI